MRVLHVTPYFAPAFGFGGPPQSILGLCKALVADGVDVEVFTTTANAAGELEANSAGTRYEGVPVRYFPVGAPRLLLGSRALHAALDRAARDADAIHVHGLFNATSWAGAAVARRHRRPLAVSVRGMLEPAALNHHRFRKQVAWALFDRRTVAHADLVHCTSAHERRSVERAGFTRTIEIPNPVDLSACGIRDEDRQALRRKMQIPDAARIVLFLGRLHPIKRLDLVAAAFAQVAQRFHDVHLVIAGEGQAIRRDEIEAAAGNGVARVHWAGAVYQRDRDVLLSDASSLVLCSDSENFGMSVAEALMCGVPPFVTETCPWAVLEQTGAGRWVPQTADAIATALCDLLDDREAAARMGVRGRALAAERFAPSEVSRLWRAAYQGLV
jgi:glycosyltransferase involved in cell wall biosynthesis